MSDDVEVTYSPAARAPLDRLECEHRDRRAGRVRARWGADDPALGRVRRADRLDLAELLTRPGELGALELRADTSDQFAQARLARWLAARADEEALERRADASDPAAAA